EILWRSAFNKNCKIEDSFLLDEFKKSFYFNRTQNFLANKIISEKSHMIDFELVKFYVQEKSGRYEIAGRLFKSCFHKLSEKEKKALYSLAYEKCNYYIYEEALPKNLPEYKDYAINLMWINKDDTNKANSCLFGLGEKAKNMQEDLVAKIASWQELNKNSNIYLWYDSKRVQKIDTSCLKNIENVLKKDLSSIKLKTQVAKALEEIEEKYPLINTFKKQVENVLKENLSSNELKTQVTEALENIKTKNLTIINQFKKQVENTLKEKHLPIDKFQVRDIRKIDLLNETRENKKVAECFRKEVSVYYRVDLLKAIISDHILIKKEHRYSIFIDIDAPVANREKLFPKKTIEFLKKYGFVMANGGLAGYENGFHIAHGRHEKFMETHRNILIESAIRGVLFPEQGQRKLVQEVYDAYKYMCVYLLNKIGEYPSLIQGNCIINVQDTNEYDKMFKISDRITYALIDKIHEEYKYVKPREVMPRSPSISLPPSHFC
ncbi:MAG: hypothetical protein AAF443_04560, partial [Chlamydiota bacterium]